MADPHERSGPDDLERLVNAGRALFERTFDGAPALVASAPGRINLIGEHTDYNDGLAMPGAIDRWVVVALSTAAPGEMEVYSEAFDERAAASLAGNGGESLPAWGRLPRGVGRLFGRRAGVEPGFRATISGNLPRGAGLSSSAAVEVAFLNALRAAFDADLDDLELILTAQRVEHECLGVATGLMDQYTSQLARAGSLMVIDFATMTHTRIDAGFDGWSWVLLDTKIRHELAASAYGERVQETRVALAQVAESDPRVRSFRDLADSHLNLIDDGLLRARLRHYIGENERVRAAAAAAEAGDTDALGDLMFASHASLRDDYAVSCAELDALVDAAHRSPGCAGARMMGGGFGGCTINLVNDSYVSGFVARVAADFERLFGYAPDARVYRLVGGARVH